jgi:hypothetical protein
MLYALGMQASFVTLRACDLDPIREFLCWPAANRRPLQAGQMSAPDYAHFRRCYRASENACCIKVRKAAQQLSHHRADRSDAPGREGC